MIARETPKNGIVRVSEPRDLAVGMTGATADELLFFARAPDE